MSDHPIPIATSFSGAFVAPTPQNTPLNTAPIGQGLSKPTVPDIEESKEPGSDEEEDVGEDEADLDSDPAAAIKEKMLQMVQGKLAGLLGKSSGYIESLPLVIRRRVEGLKGVHVDYSKLELEYKKELVELERKYLGLYKPVFERRQAILSGKAEPTEEEIKEGEALTLKDNPDLEPLSSVKEEDKEKDAYKDTKGIPEFWLTALRNSFDISNLITEQDEEALKSLSDITLEYLPGASGYVISFFFDNNDFFANRVLTKTYFYQSELGFGGNFVYDHAEGTKVDWKGDKDLTKTTEVRKQRNKNTNRTRIVKKSRKVPSFFDFFTPPVPLSEEAVKNGDIEEEELDELEFKLELDFSIGEDLKERVIPRAIDYFTGKALEYEEGEGDSEEEEEEEDGDEPRSEEDDDEDSDDHRVKKKTAKGGQKGDGECKNQ